MATPPKKNSAVVSLKAKNSIALPPMTLGFASLITPDTYEPDKPMFKLNGHLTPQALEALKATILSKVYTEEAVAKIRAMVIDPETGKETMKLKDPQDPAEWLEGKLKEPKEKARIQLPHIQISVPATYKDKSGETQTREIACWSGDKKKLNLKKLRLGMGSIVAPVVYPNLFASKLMGGIIQPSLKLVGLYVLELQQYGKGGAAPADADEEAMKEVLGENFRADDLSAYMGADDDDDEDQGAAHPSDADPADIAKGMF